MSPFVPHPLLRGPHAQTLGAKFLRSETGIHFRRETWDTPDGDILEVDFADVPGRTWAQLGDRAPVGVLLHGLEGCARTGYAHATYRAFAARGIRPVGMNYRSCGGAMPRAQRMYHAGETSDPRYVIERLADRFDVPLVAIGFSLGANILLKLQGEWGAESPLAAAAVVSPPFDLAAGVARIERGFSKVYSRYLTRRLKGKLRLRLEEFAELDLDAAAGLAGSTLRDFDEHVTAPMHGFEDAADYYARCSSGSFVGAIRTPTLVIRSLDDPFLAEDVPRAALAANPATELLLSAHGGHVAFLARGRRGGVRSWAEDTAGAWLAERV